MGVLLAVVVLRQDVGRADSGMYVAGGRGLVELGCEEASPLGCSVLPLVSPVGKPFVVDASPLVEVPLGLASSEEVEGRFSKRIKERRRLSIGPFDI